MARIRHGPKHRTPTGLPVRCLRARRPNGPEQRREPSPITGRTTTPAGYTARAARRTGIEEIETFLTGQRPPVEGNRVLATILFTDIVGSTERASTLGDRAWRELLDRFRATVRENLQRYRGREINTRGDDFLATFDGPARAINCARAITSAVSALDVEVRTGIHTGEVELMGDDIAGIAVHIGARVCALAGAGDVLVTSVVRDLVAGSGIDFAGHSRQPLKGVSGEWTILCVA